ncbi:MAG: hypothetical protein LBF55_05355 [Prevotellaceae bacterium]|nr:hypothetical protein [Prevotellaceae bacterium]
MSLQCLCNGLMVGKFCSVVAGNGMHLLPVGGKQPDNGFRQLLAFFPCGNFSITIKALFRSTMVTFRPFPKRSA